MAQYIVQGGQNIWDVALQLYGSIEGAFDLFVCNPQLTMTTNLKTGDILQYNENFIINSSIVETIKEKDWLPVNGERKVYFKTTDAPLRALGKLPAEFEYTSFSLSGEGVMYVDWGDNSDLQTVQLSISLANIEHYFDNTVDTRQIKIYGDFTLMHLDLSKFQGSLYPVSSMTVDQFTSKSNNGDLRCLFLFDGMVELDLRNSQIGSLKPIYDYGKDIRNTYNGLQILDLRGVRFTSLSVLDDYLEYIAGNSTHGGRRPCTVYLDTVPSQRGIAAIETILNEPKWNQEGFASSWKFYINDQLYTTE